MDLTSDHHHLALADLHVEEDLVVVRPHGKVEPQQLTKMAEVLMQVQRRYGRLFMIVDLKEASSLSAPMRRTMAQAMTELHPSAMAVYGGSVEQRAVHALLMGAVAGVSGRRLHASYFQTEDEARTWLASERQQFL
jgi:hypothetical protein